MSTETTTTERYDAEGRAIALTCPLHDAVMAVTRAAITPGAPGERFVYYTLICGHHVA